MKVAVFVEPLVRASASTNNAEPKTTKRLKTAHNPHNVRKYQNQGGGGGGAAGKGGAAGGQVGGLKGNFNQEGGKQVGLGAEKPKSK